MDYSETLAHMAASREDGGHGLSRDAVSRVGYDSRSLARLHEMQHGAGRDPGHGHERKPARTYAVCVYCKRRSTDRGLFELDPYFPQAGVVYRCADRDACRQRREGTDYTTP